MLAIYGLKLYDSYQEKIVSVAGITYGENVAEITSKVEDFYIGPHDELYDLSISMIDDMLDTDNEEELATVINDLGFFNANDIPVLKKAREENIQPA